MFSDLMGKIFAHAPAPTAPTAAASPSTVAPPPVPAPVADEEPADPRPDDPSPPTDEAPQAVDVTGILDGLADASDEDLNWRKSIVDLLKLVGMDSSLHARKALAEDLDYPGDEDDSAAMNVWLHKAVLQKLSENGGNVPAELLH